MENKMLKRYGHVTRMEDNRWPERIMTWSPEGSRRRGRPEAKWDEEVERVMKKRNWRSGDAVRQKLWRLETSNRWTTRNLTDLGSLRRSFHRVPYSPSTSKQAKPVDLPTKTMFFQKSGCVRKGKVLSRFNLPRSQVSLDKPVVSETQK